MQIWTTRLQKYQLCCVFQLRSLLWCNGRNFQGFSIHIAIEPSAVIEGAELLEADSKQSSSSQQRALLHLHTAGQTSHPCTSTEEHRALTLQHWATINGAQEVAFIQLFICIKFQVHRLCILRVTFHLGGNWSPNLLSPLYSWNASSSKIFNTSHLRNEIFQWEKMLFISNNLQLLSSKYNSEDYLILNSGLLTCKQSFLMISKNHLRHITSWQHHKNIPFHCPTQNNIIL